MTDTSSEQLTHFDAAGQAHMVDVAAKSDTHRIAVAAGTIRMQAATLALVLSGTAKKGDVLGIARIAAIMGAKRTSDLIPLCHPLMLSKVSVDLTVRDGAVDIEAIVETTGQTGVEMEALTACSVAALTLYDMCKSADKAMVISEVALWEKSGGRSGDFRRQV